MNKHQLVKRHLQEFGSITSWDAIEKYGATRLSAIIYDLRYRDGMNIDTMMIEATDRYGNTSQYAKYIYKEND